MSWVVVKAGTPEYGQAMTTEVFYPFEATPGRWAIGDTRHAPIMGRDYSSPDEAVEAFQVYVWPRGGDLRVIRAPDGSIERIEMSTAHSIVPPSTRYTANSLREIDRIGLELAALLRQRAAVIASREGRHQVTESDIRGALAEAISDLKNNSEGPD